MTERSAAQRLQFASQGIDQLLAATIAAADARAAAIAQVPPDQRASARNLAHYLAVRSHDLRPLQRELANLSLSSLGRMEGNVQHTLQGVAWALGLMRGEPTTPHALDALSPEEAARLLAEHTVQLLGPAPQGRQARIMVTLPTAAMQDRELLRALLDAGMDIVRINLAHDGPEVWTSMVQNLRTAEAACGRRCKILVDLPGPKLRTGEVVPGPRVLRVRPERDELGRVVRAAVVVLHDPVSAPRAAIETSQGTMLPLQTPLAALAMPGDELRLEDTRGRQRRLVVQAVHGTHVVATVDRTTYFAADAPIELHRDGRHVAQSAIGVVPPKPGFIPLAKDDVLVLTRDPRPGEPAVRDQSGEHRPAHVPCTLPAVFPAVTPGQRILFDDGRISGQVLAASADALSVRITEVPPGGARLRAEKGINLPDAELPQSALTESDLACLDWIAANADIVGMSFVQRPEDVLRLHQELERRGRSDLGIVLKIETKAAFERLPELLFAGLQSPPLGVMVARGDLAVEVGYARLAEVQEEILWLCEAAHLPVVWATQVLDSMAKTGVPSRAEVTDAAMGVRAECVMLNKGPFIVETTRFLGALLERMQQHQTKKRSMLRRLRVAGAPPHGPAQPPPP